MASQGSDLAGDAVVISGIAGRFPNSNNVLEFQKNLFNKVDCTTTEHGRWKIDHPDIPQRIGSTNDIVKFDRLFFGVHNKLCNMMEPTSRLLLEHSVEAIIDAGINPRNLKGENIAVFVATNLSESEKNIFQRVQADGFGIMGSSKAMIPNRISFSLGLTGTSVHMDAGAVGATAALEQAHAAIKSGLCDAAIVAGGILSLHPQVSYQLKILGLLSPDGVTRSFDDNGNGHTRSDGISALFLQRARDAKRIYTEVLNVRTIHTDCNDVNSVLYPKIESQVDLMKQLLRESRLSPSDISFLEATGTGIRDIDADELEAIDRVYKNRKEPLLVGSVSSNVGDAIPVNTINAVIKMILASEHGQMPPNLNYKTPNSKVECLKTGRVRIQTQLTPWNGKHVSVNTLAESGTFGNVLLRNPCIKKKNNGVPEDDVPRLIVVSGRTEEAAEEMLKFIESIPVDVELLQMFYDLFESGIDGHLYRGYTVLPAKGLVAAESKKREVGFDSGENRQIWWVFSGMGSQWSSMGKELLKLSIFNDAIKKCDAVLKPRGLDIYKIITDKDPKMFDEIINSFVGIAAVQIGLVDVLRYVGLEPDFIIGHSVGELGCAYADGCMSAEQMVLAALSRGLASKEAELIRGSMAAVGLGYDAVKPLCPPDIDIACHNGPDSTTISGPAESMKAFVADLTAKGIFAREVPSSNIAYHSRYIAPAAPKLLQRLQEVIPKPNPRSAKWVSTSVPQEEWKSVKARLCSAEYHTNNLLSAVLFDETSRLIPPNAICIEIAPHGLLQAILKKSLPSSCINIPLTRRGHPDNVELVLTALGKMYNLGLQPKISNLYPKIKYPVGRGTPSISPFVRWDHSADWVIDLFTPAEESKHGAKTVEINLNNADHEYLKGSVINGKVIIPLSLYLVEAWEIFKSFSTAEILDVIFEDIKIHKLLLPVPEDDIISVVVEVGQGTGKIEVVDANETLIASATIKSTSAASQDRLDVYRSKRSDQVKYDLNQEDIYTELQMRGFKYSGDFKNVLKASFDGSNGIVRWRNNWITFIDSVLQLYAFGNDARQVEVPLSIRKIVIDLTQQEAATKNSKELKVTVDQKLNYISAGGLEIQGLQLSALPKTVEQNRLSNDILTVDPNIDESNSPLADNLRSVLQIILENTHSKKIREIQMIDDRESQDLRAFNAALYTVPEASLFKSNVSTIQSATFDMALTVIASNIGNYDFEDISRKLREGRFLLITFANNKKDSYIKLAESLGLKMILIRRTGNNTLTLIRKTRSFTKTHVVNVSQNIQKTVDTVNMTVKKSSESERTAIIIKSNENNMNMSEFINQLEQKLNLEKIRIFVIQGVNIPEDPFLDQFYKSQLELDLFMNILTPKKVWATLRRTAVIVKAKSCQSWAANQALLYDPMNIEWTEGTAVESIENIIQVEYSALNPQDLLIANGSFYAETLEKSRLKQTSLGFEFSGIDVKFNRIMGISCGNALANFIDADAGWTWVIPKTWSFEDAATVPFSYVIAYWALVVKAEVNAKEKVLFTNACDGITLAMLNLALHKKCEVFVAYKTEAEKQLIKAAFPQLPAKRLLKFSNNSFRDEILLQTEGKGVDVAIANQCEIKQLEVLFNAVKNNARVVLISDLNDSKIHENVGMYIFLKELSLFSVVPRKILLSELEVKKKLVNMLQDGINNGSVKPLTRTVYSRDALNKAFNACVSKESLGKIVLKVMPEGAKKNEAPAIPRLHCLSRKSYLIIEGLTAFGLELIDWLITRGARRFVIASTLKLDDGYKNLRLGLWQSYGVQIILRKEIDLSQQQNIKTLFKEASNLGPVDAVFDLRRTDLTSNKLTFSSDVLDSTTKNVDQESRSMCPELRLFVICSAVANSGALVNVKKSEQYSISSSEQRAVEEIIEKRKKDGHHGLLIRLGLIENAYKRDNTQDEAPVSKYVLKLGELLGTEENVVEISSFSSPVTEVEEHSVETHAKGADTEQSEAKSLFEELLKNDHGMAEVLKLMKN